MAIKVSGVSLKVEGAAAFKQELDKANSALRKNKAEMEKLDATYGKGSTDREYLTQRQEQLTARLEAQKLRTAALRQARDAYAAQADATAAGIEKLDLAVLKSETQEAAFRRQIGEVNDALAQQEAAAQEAGDSQARLAQDTAKAGQAAGNAAEKWERAAKSLGSAGKKLTLGVTTPLIGAGTVMVKEAMALEDAMYTVATLPGVAAEEIPAYTSAILEASSATGIAAEELAQAQYQAISAGQSAEDSVHFVQQSAKAAKAGLTDTATVVNGATSILNAWGSAAGGVDHVLDVLAVAQNEGKTTIGDIASQIGQLTGLAPQLNISLDDTLAAVAALTKNGVGTSQAINGLKAVMSNVIKPTAEAGEAAKRLGLDFSAAALQGKGLSGFLQDVMEKTGGSTEVLAKLFGSVEGLNQVMLLGGAAAGDYADILGKMGTSAGTMEEAFSTRTSSQAEKLSASMNKLKNAGMDLAGSLSPAVDTVTGFLSGVGDVLSGMDDGAQQAMVTVLGATAAVGPLLSAAGKLMPMGPALKALFTGPAGWITLAAAGAVALGVHLANLKTPMEQMIESIDGRLENLNVSVNQESVNAMTASINSGIDAAKKTHEVTVKIANETDIAADLTDSAFADGRMDYQEYREFSSWVSTYVVPDIQAAQKTVAQERKAFFDSLNGKTDEDGNTLTYQQKQAMADEAVKPLNDIVTALDNAKKEYQQLLSKIYQSGGTATEEELARMEELLGRIGEYRTQLAILQDDAMDFMAKQYGNVISGHGSATEVGASFGYVEELYKQEQATIDQQRTELEKSRTEAVAAAGEDAAALAKAEETYASGMAALDKAAQESVDKRYAGYNAIFEGVAKKAGQEDWLSAVGDRLQMISALTKGYNDLEEASKQRDLRPEDMAAYQSESWMALWEVVSEEKMGGKSPWQMLADPHMENAQAWFAKAMEMYTADLEALMGENQSPEVMAALEAMLTNVDVDSLDFTRLSGPFADAMRLHLVEEGGLDALGTEMMEKVGTNADDAADAAGQAAGSSLASGIADGLYDDEPTLLSAMQDILNDLNGIAGTGVGIPVYTVPQGFSGVGMAAGAGASGSATYSTNVTIMRADMGSRASVEGLVHQLSAYQRASMAGVGVIG